MAQFDLAGYERIFKIPAFRLFWLGFAFSAFGDSMTRVALTWLVYEETGSGRALGLLMLCYTGPILVGGLMAGWLLDRFDRRKVMLADNLIRGAAVATIPLLHAIGRLELWNIYVVAAIYGLLMMISLAGGPSLIPSIVPASELSTANALEMLGWTIGGIAGPALAGVLIGLIGATNVVLIDALTYLGFGMALLMIVRITPAVAGHAQAAAGAGYSIWQAVRLMVSSRVLLTTTLMFMAFNVGNGMLFVWLPLMTDQTLGGGPGLYGMLLAVLASGEVIAVILAGSLVINASLGAMICVAQFSAGASLLIPYLSRSVPGTVIGLVVFGICSAPMTIWAQTLRMRIIPEAMRGRTFALLRMIMQGGNPIGGALGGLLAGVVAIPSLIVTSAVLIMSPAVVGFNVRELREAGPPSSRLEPPPPPTVGDVEEALLDHRIAD